MSVAIPFFSGARDISANWARYERRLRPVVQRGVFTAGPAVEALERALCEATGAAAVVATGSGTDALILMLSAAGIGPGDEVIVPAYTFFATASAVIHVGAEPVLVDIVPGSYGIDVDRAAEALSPRTRAIMPVHLFTQMCDIARVAAFAQEHELELLEDSAEAIGMWADGRHAGLWGRAGALSFFPTKTLGALGDAGAVLTRDLRMARRIRRLGRHGQAPDREYVHLERGFNSRCDELQAAIVHARLECLKETIEKRAALAAAYDEGLADLAPRVATPWMAPARAPSNPVYYVYLIEADRRDELARFLAGHGVGTEAYYPRPLSAQPALACRRGARWPVPVATAASRRALALPLYPDLAPAAVDRVCELIHDFYRSRP
jgi:UDP-2-acetamido-2-deoxy-ribo-hexuluronate aminotransferase